MSFKAAKSCLKKQISSWNTSVWISVFFFLLAGFSFDFSEFQLKQNVNLHISIFFHHHSNCVRLSTRVSATSQNFNEELHFCRMTSRTEFSIHWTPYTRYYSYIIYSRPHSTRLYRVCVLIVHTKKHQDAVPPVNSLAAFFSIFVCIHCIIICCVYSYSVKIDWNANWQQHGINI